jgi:SAM-dependent methyltransferase
MAVALSRNKISSSFRDPSGFLFLREGELYRQVNQYYREDYDLLISSGLYSALTEARLLVPHREVEIPPEDHGAAYKVIKPEPVPFISYPYEWSFSQLRDAALATLAIQKRALAAGMILKDASAYNIQFIGPRPVFIDTLSFARYREGEPWVAYRQFCQHFLAPLALMSRRDIRLGGLLRLHIDGVPLDLASSLLPRKTRFSFSLLSHIHLHARSQARHADDAGEGIVKTIKEQRKVSKLAFRGIIDSLESAVKKLSWKPGGTEWGEYYGATNYTPAAREDKKKRVAEYLSRLSPKLVWDLGANTGIYSRLAVERGAYTVASDIDPAAVEKNYLRARAEKEENILPLLLDLTNPSPGIGWAHRERTALLERGPADAVLALALVHHLAISNNLPFFKIAEFLKQAGRDLIIEFIPKEDSQVRRLLASREDIFPDYHRESFERVFSAYFKIEDRARIADSERTIYLMRGIAHSA